jgi:hypothetical protein
MQLLISLPINEKRIIAKKVEKMFYNSDTKGSC